MRYAAFASDYDGTLAHDGVVEQQTIEAITRLRQSGRKLILVTGRHLPDLMSVFPQFDLFDCLVVENGAVLYTTATREKQVLAPPPNPQFVAQMQRRGVQPLGIGEAIVATWEPNQTVVLEAIRDLGLELQVIFNKGAVMVLPSGINKRSGLGAALNRLGLSEHNVVGVGDAENDHVFLQFCELAVAVSNAHPAVKETADFTTQEARGAGVVELIGMLLQEGFEKRPVSRHSIAVGTDGNEEFRIPAFGSRILIAGASGSGKSTLVAGLLETLIEQRYQVCLIDPEGDYTDFNGAITVGDEKHPPSAEELMQVLKKPDAGGVVNLIAVPVLDRPAALTRLLPKLQDMRKGRGRPHWIVIDEAHHMLAPDSTVALPEGVANLALITVHPEHVASQILRGVDFAFAIGPNPGAVLDAFAKAAGLPAPAAPGEDLGRGEALAWQTKSTHVHKITTRRPRAERKRHVRNYAVGEVGDERSFYFRGPEEKLNLRAENLMRFLQLAEGVDDSTWLHHLRRFDYSTWFRNAIKDPDLADEVAAVEREAHGNGQVDPRETRVRIGAAIHRRYTTPA